MNIKLKPSMREKRHYLLIKSSKPIEEKELKARINEAILKFIGILGYANAGPLFVKIEDEKINKLMQEKNLIVLSVITKFVDHVKAALILAKTKEIQLECIRVSGTIKKLKEFVRSLD
ncbi:MAG: Rpp14/Pop5 family protein [Candidatus Pacearchaeota archaeon]